MVGPRSRFHSLRSMSHLALAPILAATIACGGGTGTPESPAANSTGSTAAKAQPEGATAPAVPTAKEPDDPCKWIPVGEVEAVVGKLAEPPKREDGCLYTMVMPESVSARRQQMVEQQEKLQAQLKARFKDYEPPEFDGSIANYQRDPKNYALTVSVKVDGDLAGEMGMSAAGKMLESMLSPAERREAQSSPAAPKEEPTGWDRVTGVPYGFIGRVGHVQVAVQGKAPDVPRELMQTLAARVRDRVPDLPFPATNTYQVMQLGEQKDPCGLLTRAEAEAVLGKLVVDPYRSSSYYPPLAHPKGHSCAYFTAGHHVFVLTPRWEDGKQDFAMEKGIGGLVGMVMPKDQITVIKGPWDKAQISNMTGTLQFLKGDRLLEVNYMTSSTDRKGAVKLAAQAMQRLVS